MMADTIMPPVHPGRDPADRVLEPLRVNQYQLAYAVEMPAGRINQIVHGRRRISADRALRLALYFGTEWFWMNLQTRYGLKVGKDRLGSALDGIQPLSAAS